MQHLRSTRQGRHPSVSLRLAKLLKQQRGRCRYCGLCFQHDDRVEMDLSMLTTTMRALPICKRCMDTATMRKRGSIETISHSACVTSIGILRSGVRRKSHAPFWNSGRRSDPPTDCNRVNLSIRQHAAAVGGCVTTLCKSEDGLRQQLALSHGHHIFACHMPAYTSPYRSLSPPTATARLSGGSPVRQPWRPG